MVELLIEKFHDVRLMVSLLAAVATAATIYTLAYPFFVGETLAKRMRAVASERERLRLRERAARQQQSAEQDASEESGDAGGRDRS